MRAALIAKPSKEKNNIAYAVEKMAGAGVHCELFVTQYHSHAYDIVRGLPIKEFDALIAMGGDGTNYHILNGLLRYHGQRALPPIGIIPQGRGNSFARDLNIYSLEGGIKAVSNQRTSPVDICQFTQGDQTYFFVNLMGFGFVTDVARTAAWFSRTGDFSYIIGVFHRMLGLKFHKLEMEIDGKVFEGQNCFVEFCNSRYTGGEMLMAPDARIDDGYFDAVIVSPMSRLSLISSLTKIFKGTHTMIKQVETVRGKNAKVRTSPSKFLLPDGEIFGVTPTTIKVLPGRVEYFS